MIKNEGGPQNKKPILGICIGPSNNKKRYAFYHLINTRLEHYDTNKFKNIIIFAKDNLNLEKLEVTGQVVIKTDEGIVWEKGTLPIPDVIYVQSEFKHEELLDIESVLPGKVFNNHFYDKYEGYSILKSSRKCKRYLPETKLIETLEDVETSIKRYRAIYLKPVYGYLGRGIISAGMNEFGEIWTISIDEEMKFKSIQDFTEWLVQKNISDNYIIQQSINTVEWKKKTTDMRLNMCKNGMGEWGVSFLAGRVALTRTYVSGGDNILLHIDPFLEELFPNKNIEKIKNQIIDLGFKICNAFDRTNYHMADFGIDLGIDPDGKLWIFEVNHLPYPFKKLDDKSLTLPLDYAYYLTQDKGD